jgi:hypothetical protein
MMDCGDDVAADPGGGQRAADGGREADSVQGTVDCQRDPLGDEVIGQSSVISGSLIGNDGETLSFAEGHDRFEPGGHGSNYSEHVPARMPPGPHSGEHLAEVPDWSGVRGLARGQRPPGAKRRQQAAGQLASGVHRVRFGRRYPASVGGVVPGGDDAASYERDIVPDVHDRPGQARPLDDSEQRAADYLEASLFPDFPHDSLLVGLTGLNPATGHRPQALSGLMSAKDEQHAPGGVFDDRSDTWHARCPR